MKWNKISEENLPEDQQTCFVYCPFVVSGFVMIDTFNEHEENKWLEDYTHWMPMEFPNAPASE